MVEQVEFAEEAARRGDKILICGASFAGLATAWWMSELGFEVTVVEVASGLRKGGTPVDIEGQAIDALTRMGLMEAVRAAALPPRAIQFKNIDDSTIGEVTNQPASGDKFEIHRDDLLDILFAALKGRGKLAFGRTVTQLTNGPDDVAVTFNDGSRKHYALVLGCDGNRSLVRRLAFDEGHDFSHFLGCYGFLMVVPDIGLLPADTTQIYGVPGRTVFLNGYADRTDIGLAFRSESEIAYDYRDKAQQRVIIHEQFDDLGWKVPAVLAHLDEVDDFYFDRMNQIRMPCWSAGRVALVGDAGYCVSPLAGMGGSMAIIGAARLADAVSRHRNDHVAAFVEYRACLHVMVEQVQLRAVEFGLAVMFPADHAQMAERDARIRAGILDL
jgi:2-polyprenyl-6-methoxyphenol hydroxylase-like FAD-dependent oxidoreductase